MDPKNAVYPYVSVRKSSLTKLSKKLHYLKTQQKKLYMKSSAFNKHGKINVSKKVKHLESQSIMEQCYSKIQNIESAILKMLH